MGATKSDLAKSKRLYHLLYGAQFEEAAALFATLDPDTANAYRTSGKADSAYLIAARRGQLAIVKRFVDTPDWNVNQCDAMGWTALCMAACRGQWRVVHALLKAGAHPNLATAHGVSAIYFACMSGCVAVYNALLEHGADPFAHRYAGASCLWVAARFGHASIVRGLLSWPNVPIDETSALLDNQTPLWTAAAHGHGAVVALLRAHGANYLLRCDQNLTPLAAAVSSGSLSSVVALLASEVPADPTPRDALTPIALAVYTCAKDIIDVLLRANVNLSASNPRNPLLYEFAEAHSLAGFVGVYRARNPGLFLLPRKSGPRGDPRKVGGLAGKPGLVRRPHVK